MIIKKIDEFQPGEKVDGFFLIRNMEKKTSANGKEYYDMTVIDDTGSINTKIWEAEKGKGIEVNDFVKIRGEITLWRDFKQFKVHKIRKVNEEDNVDIEDYIQSAPYKGADMLDTIMNYIDGFKNEDIKKLTKTIVNSKAEKLLYYPAAKENHHSIRSGLLYHILRMIKSAEKLIEVYTDLNSDLVFSGVILHDLAKIEEMDANELGIVSDYTKEGKLLGHIIQGIKEIDRVSKELEIDEEISILIQHMILSHHYYPEYGSPKFPMIPEAELLHYLDIIDARLYDMDKAISDLEIGQFSPRIWTLDNRQVYKRKDI
ncbi:MAG: HD domain-containing protein [Andreesenia angusta]|nr:HD domain-containing protein [Andreesenia angusta]